MAAGLEQSDKNGVGYRQAVGRRDSSAREKPGRKIESYLHLLGTLQRVWVLYISVFEQRATCNGVVA